MSGTPHSQSQNTENGDPTESSLLLATTNHAIASDLESSRRPFKLPHTYFIIPALFGIRLTDIIVTATIVIAKNLVCYWWYAVNDPNSLPSDGSNPTEQQCAVPGVDQALTVVITISGVLEGIGGLITSGFASHFATLYGRKFVLLVLILINLFGTACFLMATYISNIVLLIGLLIAWVLLSSSSTTPVLTLVCNMYVVDTTAQEQRTSMLSFVSGLSLLATVPSFWLGGVISENLGAIMAFWIKFAILLVVALYVAFILPESFSIDKQKAARREAIASRTATSDSTTTISIMQRIIKPLMPIIEPLRFLTPTRNPQTGRLNMRLLIITVSHLITSMGSQYIPIAIIIYATLHFRFKPDELGLTLSGLTLSHVIWLSFVFPLLVQFIRPLYIQHRLRKGASKYRPINLQEDEDEQASAIGRLDIYIAFGSIILWTLAIIGIGLSSSKVGMIAAAFSFAMGSAHDPSIKAIAVASVDPLHNAQILSALAIVFAIATLLAPLTIGSILSATIATKPQIAFFVSAILIFTGGLFLFFVQDSDRYLSSDISADGDDEI